MKIISALLLILLFGCTDQDPELQKQQLNGYWEIESVQLSDGTTREFNLSTTIDYFEIKGDSGVRKKVAPKLDGSFTTTNSAEKLLLKVENDSLNLYYQTPFDSWKETVISLKDSTLVILNSEGKRYKYKRFQKFNFN